MEELIKKIKEKKELRGIADEIVREEINRYLKKKGIKKEELDKKGVKELIKGVRAELRGLVGRFDIYGKREKLADNEDFIGLLKTHASTRERLEIYPELKRKIDKMNAESILDLGCGLNPIGIAKKGVKYYACDIKEDELELVKRYFEKENIDGKVFVCELRKEQDILKLPEAELCLIMKVFDVLEKRGHKLAEKILRSLKCRFIIISFSTKTLSGKPMNHPQRGWIERLLSRLGWEFELWKTRNEIFYFVKIKNISNQ